MTDDTPAETCIQLEAEPASAGEVRRFVAATLGSWGRSELSDRAALVVGELVTNAILHGLGPIDVALRLEAGPPTARLSIEVHDRQPRLPVPTARSPDAALAFGRGLHLVEAISVAWGARPTTDGKVVWATVEPPS